MTMSMEISRLPAAAAPALSFTLLTDVADAEALRPAWLRLLDDAERTELTQSPDWLLSWWRVYGGLDGRRLRLGLFHDGERLVGLAPLLFRRHWYRGLLPFRRLELVGSGEPAAHGIYSNHLSVIAARTHEARVALRLAAAIAADEFGRWDDVVLTMMAADTSMPERLADAFRVHNFAVETTTIGRAPYITLPATWTEYLHSLSPNSRRNITRSLKAFDRWAGGTMELECISAADGIPRGKDILIQLHHDRWTGAGVFRSPHYLSFHDQIMHRLAERGELELLVLRARGEPVAALYSMVWEDKVYAYQTGRRPDVPGNARPGGVILALAIRRAIERNRREFDLLADDAFYKRQLTPRSRPQVQVRAARQSLVESMRRFGAACVQAVRPNRASRNSLTGRES